MIRVPVLGGTILLALTLSGCGSNPREDEINKALNLYQSAASSIKGVREQIDKVVNSAKKDTKLKKDDYKEVIEQATKLKDVGKQLMAVRSRIESWEEQTTPAQKEELAEQFRPKLQSMVAGLTAEQAKLDQTLERAEKVSTEDAITHLRSELRDAQNDFFVLAKPR